MRSLRRILVGAVAVCCMAATAGHAARIKNIILLIPDGCAHGTQTISRWYKGTDLMLDSMSAGAVKTWMTNSIIPGSAAAGTAMATGFKTTEPFIAVGPRTSDAISTYEFPYAPEFMSYRPMATVLEAAKSKGKATGLVVTSTISHATPAAFSAHIDSRSNEQGIIEHQVYQNMDVVFGGNRRHLVTRADGENLRDTLISRGYEFVETRDQMLALSGGKVWGMFANGSLQPDIDRAEFAPTEPSLAEMTRKAIELLSQNERGFFLMVEGSQVDWAGHNNDPIYMVTDFLAFDEAVRVAVNFAKADGQTAVIALPDHNTGGMTLGSYFSDKRIAYDRMPPEFLVDPLKGMKITSQGVAAKIADKTNAAEIKEKVLTWWGITLSDADVTEILSWPHSTSFNYRLASVVSKNHTAIGWTTHGHTGEDVPLWYYNAGICGVGTIENTQVGDHIFKLLNVDKLELNKELFVDVNDVFNGFWSIQDEANALNKVLVIADPARPGYEARLPISKDEVYTIKAGDRRFRKRLLDGLVVHAPVTGRVYITRKTVDLIKRHFAEI